MEQLGARVNGRPYDRKWRASARGAAALLRCEAIGVLRQIALGHGASSTDIEGARILLATDERVLMHIVADRKVRKALEEKYFPPGTEPEPDFELGADRTKSQ